MAKWYPIIENDAFIVEYNKETNTYRVSYFEDNHFKDEILFKGYEWKEETPEKTYTLEDFEKSLEDVKRVMETYEPPTYVPPACVNCPNHPSNGGNGICHCTLGLQPITYGTSDTVYTAKTYVNEELESNTPYTTHTTMITDGCAAKGLRKEGETK